MSELQFDSDGRAITARLSEPFQDPQTRALTVRLTVTCGDETLWRDFVRANPLRAAFFQDVLGEEAGLTVDDETARALVSLIRSTCRR